MYHVAGLAFVLASACLLASLLLCWPLCRSAGLSAALLASLPLCWPLCRSAALLASLPLCWPLCRSAALLASLPLCWPLCRSAALLACCLRFGLPGDSRLPFSLSACAWCFFAVGYIAALLICAASTFHAGLSFQLPNLQFL